MGRAYVSTARRDSIPTASVPLAAAPPGDERFMTMGPNRLKPYDLLSGEDVEAIHEQAMTILEEIGVDFLHDRPRELFGKAGMAVDGMRARFDRGFIMEMAAKTPPTFTLQARNPLRT